MGLWLLLKIGSNIEKIAVTWEGGLAELVRIRSSLTAGNVAQVCLGLQEKIGYIERRAMGAQCQQVDFWRSLKTEVLEVEWRSIQAGSSAFRSTILEFVGTKFTKMPLETEIPKEVVDKFRVDLAKQIASDIEKKWMTQEVQNMWEVEVLWLDTKEFTNLFHRQFAVWNH